jgi:hypothetical protein
MEKSLLERNKSRSNGPRSHKKLSIHPFRQFLHFREESRNGVVLHTCILRANDAHKARVPDEDFQLIHQVEQSARRSIIQFYSHSEDSIPSTSSSWAAYDLDHP